MPYQKNKLMIWNYQLYYKIFFHRTFKYSNLELNYHQFIFTKKCWQILEHQCNKILNIGFVLNCLIFSY